MNGYPLEMRTTASRPTLAVTSLALMAGMGIAQGATSASIPDGSRFRFHVQATAIPESGASASAERPLPVRECVLEIRRLSGLTWDELARVFSVSRRSIHNWALGERLTDENAEKVRRVLTNVRKLFDSSPARTAGILRGMQGARPLLEELLSVGIADGSGSRSSDPTYPVFESDASRLVANWNPSPLAKILESESGLDDAPLGNMKPSGMRVPKLPKRPSAG